jgi:hypothetical protein
MAAVIENLVPPSPTDEKTALFQAMRLYRLSLKSASSTFYFTTKVAGNATV